MGNSAATPTGKAAANFGRPRAPTRPKPHPPRERAVKTTSYKDNVP